MPNIEYVREVGSEGIEIVMVPGVLLRVEDLLDSGFGVGRDVWHGVARAHGGCEK